MSSKGIAWALEQRTERAVDKLVLILLGEAHGHEKNLAYPSLKWLVEHTGLDRKTVIGCMDRLETGGLIHDTGQRLGKTKQIKCFTLKGVICGTVSSNSPIYPDKGSTCGTRNLERNKGSEPKGSSPRASAKRAGAIPDDWQPNVPLLSATAKETAKWPREFFTREVERFVGHHQSKGTLSKNWNRQWMTWALSPYRQKDLREWENERAGGGQGGNAFLRAASRRVGASSGRDPRPAPVLP